MIAGCNVIAADSVAAAADQLLAIRRTRAVGLFARSRGVSSDELELADADADQLLGAGLAAHVDEMLTYAAVGTPAQVASTSTDSVRRRAPTS